MKQKWFKRLDAWGNFDHELLKILCQDDFLKVNEDYNIFHKDDIRKFMRNFKKSMCKTAFYSSYL
jgi:hypothetical protein